VFEGAERRAGSSGGRLIIQDESDSVTRESSAVGLPVKFTRSLTVAERSAGTLYNVLYKEKPSPSRKWLLPL